MTLSLPDLSRFVHNLSAAVPSEAPYIKNYANGSKVEALYTDSSLMLECIAENGRPAADIQWFRNGLRVSTCQLSCPVIARLAGVSRIVERIVQKKKKIE